MNRPKGTSLVTVIISIILAALIVGGAGYYLFNSRVQDLEQQVKDLQISKQETPMPEKPTIDVAVTNDECYKTYSSLDLPKEERVGLDYSFEYPCDWKTNVQGGSTYSATGTVVAPDGKASFNYPAPDMGLEGSELVEQGTATINGNVYPTKKYEGNGGTLVLIEMGKSLYENGANIMLSYESSAHADEFDHILKTFKF